MPIVKDQEGTGRAVEEQHIQDQKRSGLNSTHGDGLIPLFHPTTRALLRNGIVKATAPPSNKVVITDIVASIDGFDMGNKRKFVEDKVILTVSVPAFTVASYVNLVVPLDEQGRAHAREDLIASMILFEASAAPRNSGQFTRAKITKANFNPVTDVITDADIDNSVGKYVYDRDDLFALQSARDSDLRDSVNSLVSLILALSDRVSILESRTSVGTGITLEDTVVRLLALSDPNSDLASMTNVEIANGALQLTGTIVGEDLFLHDYNTNSVPAPYLADFRVGSFSNGKIELPTGLVVISGRYAGNLNIVLPEENPHLWGGFFQFEWDVDHSQVSDGNFYIFWETSRTQGTGADLTNHLYAGAVLMTFQKSGGMVQAGLHSSFSGFQVSLPDASGNVQFLNVSGPFVTPFVATASVVRYRATYTASVVTLEVLDSAGNVISSGSMPASLTTRPARMDGLGGTNYILQASISAGSRFLFDNFKLTTQQGGFAASGTFVTKAVASVENMVTVANLITSLVPPNTGLSLEVSVNNGATYQALALNGTLDFTSPITAPQVKVRGTLTSANGKKTPAVQALRVLSDTSVPQADRLVDKAKINEVIGRLNAAPFSASPPINPIA